MSLPARGPSESLFVCFGGEDFFLDGDMEIARRWPGRIAITLDANGLLDAEVVSSLETQDFEGRPRTIILDEAQRLKESKDRLLFEFFENRDRTNTSSVLVAIVRGDKLPEAWTKLSDRGCLVKRKKLSSWADKSGKNDYHKFIVSLAKHAAMTLDEGVVEMLYELTGEDLYRIRNEMRKLHLYVGNGNKVTKKSVATVIAASPKTEPRDVIEAAFAKNVKGAMNSLSRLYKSMGDDASRPLVSGLMRETTKVLTARHMIDRGLSEDAIAASIGANAWWCKTFFLPTVRKHDQRVLLSLMSRLCRLDQDVKGPSRSKRTLVELTVLSIAG